jgi:hypothetical protein
MALTCNMTLNIASCVAGQTPPPQATLTVYNPNASPVVVTGVQVQIFDLDSDIEMPANAPLVPIGPGQTTLVPALSSITIGPFAISVGSAANVNSFAAVNQTGNLFAINPQPTQPPQNVITVGATVYGSDGSVNTAGVAPLLVSYTSAPPLGYQGGFLNFASPNNAAGGFLLGLF